MQEVHASAVQYEIAKPTFNDVKKAFVKGEESIKLTIQKKDSEATILFYPLPPLKPVDTEDPLLILIVDIVTEGHTPGDITDKEAYAVISNNNNKHILAIISNPPD